MPNHPQAEIAIIGGSGLYEVQEFTESAVMGQLS
jgi:purine nucleoside phosphorylase